MESFPITSCFLHQLIFPSVEIQGFWLLLNYIETRKSLMTFFFVTSQFISLLISEH